MALDKQQSHKQKIIKVKQEKRNNWKRKRMDESKENQNNYPIPSGVVGSVYGFVGPSNLF